MASHFLDHRGFDLRRGGDGPRRSPASRGFLKQEEIPLGEFLKTVNGRLYAARGDGQAL